MFPITVPFVSIYLTTHSLADFHMSNYHTRYEDKLRYKSYVTTVRRLDCHAISHSIFDAKTFHFLNYKCIINCRTIGLNPLIFII